ncbi:MAG TPA: SPFH domain-containing protein [Phycisphaerae bacterium]|nr:SPFH domain-containing protein [Phycisphaerae bacterium]
MNAYAPLLMQLPTGDGFPIEVFLVIVLLVVVMALVLFFVRIYRRCPSNKILVIYGKTGKGAAKCVHGGASFVWPIIQACQYLDLEPFVVPIDLKSALSQENIRVSVPTTVTAAISNEVGLMMNAAVRLLAMTRQEIERQAEDIILGQMRAVIATMKIEEINRDRQAFMFKVNEAVSGELEKIGLAVINVNIKDITDESGYIEAIGRKAAAEVINQANIDVAEQERLGKTGVAERERDQRKAVAAANANAEIGEATASRDRRQQVSVLEAEAVDTETQAEGKKAAYRAGQKVAEEQARQKGDSVAMQATGAIRVAEQNAQREAEQARAAREQARLRAEVVVPAEAAREQVVIQSDAEKQKRELVARGEANAILAKMKAEAEGTLAILDAKAKGYGELIKASAQDPKAATSLLVIEKLVEVAGIQAEAIRNLPLEKVIVWDGGGEGGGLSDLGRRLVGVLPPMHQLAKMVGLELPDYLGSTAGEQTSAKPKRGEAGHTSEG